MVVSLAILPHAFLRKITQVRAQGGRTNCMGMTDRKGHGPYKIHDWQPLAQALGKPKSDLARTDEAIR